MNRLFDHTKRPNSAAERSPRERIVKIPRAIPVGDRIRNPSPVRPSLHFYRVTAPNLIREKQVTNGLSLVQTKSLLTSQCNQTIVRNRAASTRVSY
jgi:hypothetical protein